MRTYTAALMGVITGCLAPAAAPAAPTLLRCDLTREVANAVNGAHISFRTVRYVTLDPEARQYAEAGAPGAAGADQCQGAGRSCRFDPKIITVGESRSPVRVRTTIDRYTLKYNSESDNRVLQSLTYGQCAKLSDFDEPGNRQF